MDNKKVHLVNWETIKTPKVLGGLGIRKTANVNDAAMAGCAKSKNFDLSTEFKLNSKILKLVIQNLILKSEFSISNYVNLVRIR